MRTLLTEWLPWLLVMILGADKVYGALWRLLRIPAELRESIQQRAERMVAEELRETRFHALADKADLILAQVVPNGGFSLHDAVARIEAKLNAHLEGHLSEPPR